MRENEVIVTKEVSLRNPVLIEGLPGIGLVGKLAAEHLVKELKAQKFAELYSPDFPPQVIIDSDSTVRLLRNEFYFWKAEKKEQNDLIILIGDHQGLTTQSQFSISGTVLDFVEHYRAKTVLTLAAFQIGKISKNPRVFGAVTDKSLVRELKKYGVQFSNLPAQAIWGAAGLLLGLGKIRDMKGICLMGETQGTYVDPKAAKSVLDVARQYLKLNIKLDALEKKAHETEEMIARFEQIQRSQQPQAPVPKDESSTYIR